MATFKSIAQHAPIRCIYVQTGAAAAAIDCYVFCNPANSNEYFEVAEVARVYDAAGAASSTVDVKIAPNGTSLASGTTVLSAAMTLDGTADTSVKATLTSTAANRLVKPGDNVGVDITGTLTGLAGLCVVVTLKPVKVVKTH